MDEKTRRLRDILNGIGPEYEAMIARKRRRRIWFYAVLLAAIAAYLIARWAN